MYHKAADLSSSYSIKRNRLEDHLTYIIIHHLVDQTLLYQNMYVFTTSQPNTGSTNSNLQSLFFVLNPKILCPGFKVFMAKYSCCPSFVKI